MMRRWVSVVVVMLVLVSTQSGCAHIIGHPSDVGAECQTSLAPAIALAAGVVAVGALAARSQLDQVEETGGIDALFTILIGRGIAIGAGTAGVSLVVGGAVAVDACHDYLQMVEERLNEGNPPGMGAGITEHPPGSVDSESETKRIDSLESNLDDEDED